MTSNGGGVEALPTRGILDRLARSLYRRWGARLCSIVAWSMVPFALFVSLVGTVTMRLYVRMSIGDVVVLAAISGAGYLVESIAGARVMLRATRPASAWLAGSRPPEAAQEAWSAAASAPMRLLRHPTLYGLGVVEIVFFNAWMVAVLNLRGPATFIMIPGCIITYAYWTAFRFLAVEFTLRPVLEELSRFLPDRSALEMPRVPLRWRLAAAMPGVNIATGAVVAGVTNNDTDNLSRVGLGVIAAVGVTATVSIWVTALLSESVAAPISALREATKRVARGDFAVRVPVVSTDETGELARSFNDMAAGLEERERLRHAFGAFVDPGLAERVLKEGVDLAGDEIDLSVLFLDIRGFTAFAEEAPAHEVVARLNDLFGQVVPLILEHGGHANKFIGDGLLAVFGAPERLPDHADRAVAAALDIAQLVRQRYDGQLRVGIGVNSGRAVVGTIGGGGRLDFTVIGDTVNTAARVESATRQTGDDVLITEDTRAVLTTGMLDWHERSAVPLKGKAQTVRLFAPAPSDGSGGAPAARAE